MTIGNLDFVKELVNAFNVSNYGSQVNTNFVVEGDNIVVKFNCDQGSAERYLSQMARDLVREYFSDESVARHVFDLESLPFNFDKGKWTRSKAGTQLTVPIDNGVIFNLKVHFAEGFKLDVKNQVIKAIDEKHHLDKKRIEEILNASIKQAKMDPSSGYIKCLLFNSPNVQTYFVKVLQEQIKKHCYNYSGFYDIDDNKVYFKDVENIDFVRSVTELYKERSGYYFRFPSDDDLNVRKYKDAMGDLIFDLTKIPIYGYYRDNFIDEGRISNGDRFAFIPITKDGSNFRYLNYMEADKINAKFSHDILTNVRGQTKDTESDEFGEVYALSDRQIALLIPVIIENSVINKEGQIEIDPGLYEKLQAPPTKLDSTRREPGVLPHVRHNVGAAEVVAAKNVQAGTGAGSQPMNPWSSSASSAGPSLWQPSRPSSWKGANGSGSAWTSEPIDSWSSSALSAELRQQSQVSSSGPSSSRGANESMRTGKSIWYLPSSYSPGVEDVNDVEHEKQQVSGECSEAKSQESESTKKHGGGTILNKILSPFKRNNKKRSSASSSVSAPGGFVTKKSSVSESSFSFQNRIKAKSNPPSGVTSPTHEGGPEWQQRLDPDQRKELRLFLSPELRKKLDSNSLSPEDEKLKYLLYTPSGKRAIKNSFENPEENLRRSVKAQLPGDRSSQASADSGLGKSPERGQSPLLIEKFSDKLLINSRVDSPNIKKHLQKEKEVFV